MPSGDSLDRISRSVSDGNPVDWDQVEADGSLDADTVDGMRDVARIAEFNRVLQRSDEAPDAAKSPLGSEGVPLQRWRDLTLLEPIGAGARGEVWRAWDSTLQRQVALKFLLTSPSDRPPAGSSDLLSEARALARVRHPSIVTVHGIAEHEGRIGMWMECVPGETLARKIERLGALSAPEVARIGLQLCAALEALETAGLVHRDIKPANILLEGEERVVLTDFGLGWRRDRDQDDSVPKSSGTPYFMAPEVLSGGKPTHQSDLYSLAVTLWWALAGHAPFEAKTLQELKQQADQGPPRSLQSLNPEAPGDLADAILWAMNAKMSARPRSAAELAARLRTAAGESGGHREARRTASIAVLPFVNRSPGNEDEYFSDGLADELIAMLGKIRGLRVAARTSAFTFRARQTTIGEIGRALNVDTVLDGSMRRSGDRVRISVQLITVADGFQLWSETYERSLDDVFAVQDDIAQSAVKELRIALEGRGDPGAEGDVRAEVAHAAKGRATNPAAHRLYLVGKHLINRLSREDLTGAIQKLHEAVALEPRFALAWTDLSGAYVRAATWELLPKEEAFQQARDAVRQALSLEPDLAEAHARLATIQLFHDWNWKGADASCARALQLAPGDTAALNTAGVVAVALGRVEESIAFHRKASEQDPLSASPHSNLGLTLQAAGRFREAEGAFRRVLELAPQRLMVRSRLAQVIAAQGRSSEAIDELSREPDERMRLFVLTLIQHNLGNRAESDRALHQLLEVKGAVHYAFQIAEVYAVRGDVDEAFDWLDRAYDQRDLGLSEIRCHDAFGALHRDSRWHDLLVKIGFEDSTKP